MAKHRTRSIEFKRRVAQKFWQPLDQHAPDVGCAEHGRRAAKRSPPAAAGLHLSAERFVSISVSIWDWRLQQAVRLLRRRGLRRAFKRWIMTERKHDDRSHDSATREKNEASEIGPRPVT